MKTTTKTNRSLTLKLINVIQNFTPKSRFSSPHFLSLFMLPFSSSTLLFQFFFFLQLFFLSLHFSLSKKCAAQMDLKIYISIFHIKCSLHFTSFLYRKEMEKKQKRRKENEEERRKERERNDAVIVIHVHSPSCQPLPWFSLSLSLSLPTTFYFHHFLY